MKKKYGQLGCLPKKEWKEFLNSNKGLFKSAKSAPAYIIGPTLDKKGQVTGDMMAMEIVFFQKVADKDQYDFFKELKKTNPQAAKEYMLTITGSINRWKEDLKWLDVAVHYLKKEEHVLRDEEELVGKGERIKASIELPPILKRHFPQLFSDMDMGNLDFEGIFKRIKSFEDKVKSEEHYLEEYIKKTKREMPFLF